MKTTHSTGSKPTRSRGGCRECRRLHRKCDETRPACHNCTTSAKSCSYNKPLSWGGRPFNKSPFRHALAGDVVAVQDTNTGQLFLHPNAFCTDRCKESEDVPCFVYGMNCTRRRIVNDAENVAPPAPPAAVDFCAIQNGNEAIQANPDWLIGVPDQYRSLIHYFTERVAPCFSLHDVHQRKYCSGLIPLALNTENGSQLLSAVLLAAATHRKSLGQEDDVNCEKLLQTSLCQLRRQKLGCSAEVDELCIATSLTLCLVEVMKGGHEQSSWRTHMKGALALLEETEHVNGFSQSNTGCLLRRWCKSFQTISLSSPQRMTDAYTSGSLNGKPGAMFDYVDMFNGFSNALLSVFEEINDLCAEKSTLETLRACTADLHLNKLRRLQSRRCQRLISRIKGMIAEPVCKLDPLLSAADLETQDDFILLNKAYHFTALLELYQRVIDKPSAAGDVQDVVCGGIETLKAMKFRDGACPAVATLHPVFTIGCSACTSHDRAFVLEWLAQLSQRYAMGNVPAARSFLLELWQQNDMLEATTLHLQWDELMRKCVRSWKVSTDASQFGKVGIYRSTDQSIQCTLTNEPRWESTGFELACFQAA